MHLRDKILLLSPPHAAVGDGSKLADLTAIWKKHLTFKVTMRAYARITPADRAAGGLQCSILSEALTALSCGAGKARQFFGQCRRYAER